MIFIFNGLHLFYDSYATTSSIFNTPTATVPRPDPQTPNGIAAGALYFQHTTNSRTNETQVYFYNLKRLKNAVEIADIKKLDILNISSKREAALTDANTPQELVIKA